MLSRRLEGRIRSDLAKLDRSGHRRLRDRDRFMGTGRFVQKPQGQSGEVTMRHIVNDSDVHEGRIVDCLLAPCRGHGEGDII